MDFTSDTEKRSRECTAKVFEELVLLSGFLSTRILVGIRLLDLLLKDWSNRDRVLRLEGVFSVWRG
jgi:hypothetical protein